MYLATTTYMYIFKHEKKDLGKHNMGLKNPNWQEADQLAISLA